jgi:hypothetical protein
MRLLAGKPAKLVAVAVANKMARIAWAIMAKGGHYRAPELAVDPRSTLGPAVMVPRKQAEHMTCTRPQAERQIPLAMRASSTQDP